MKLSLARVLPLAIALLVPSAALAEEPSASGGTPAGDVAKAPKKAGKTRPTVAKRAKATPKTPKAVKAPKAVKKAPKAAKKAPKASKKAAK